VRRSSNIQGLVVHGQRTRGRGECLLAGSQEKERQDMERGRELEGIGEGCRRAKVQGGCRYTSIHWLGLGWEGDLTRSLDPYAWPTKLMPPKKK
jgi:hypothetical protein